MDKLPPKSAFYNYLKQEDMTDDDYVAAQHVWSSLGFTKLGQLVHLYQLIDVYILGR